MVDGPPSTKWITVHVSNYHVTAFSYRNELHRVPMRVWLGTKHEYVHGAPILFLYVYTTYVGLCEGDIVCVGS